MGASSDDTVHVPDGYTWDALIPWGTPLFTYSSPWVPDASNSAADQAGQVGFNHDGMHFFPLGNGPEGNRHGLLVLNHEYTDANQIYTAAQGSAITNDAAGRDNFAKALAGHGVTTVEIRQTGDGAWEHVQGAPLQPTHHRDHPDELSNLGEPGFADCSGSSADGHLPQPLQLGCTVARSAGLNDGAAPTGRHQQSTDPALRKPTPVHVAATWGA